ncbi:hypothetical protein OAD71_03430 [Gammaproteobacteria bacterium]|nr:hypothetical protein [Gammaproteobacteria bacterium]
MKHTLALVLMVFGFTGVVEAKIGTIAELSCVGQEDKTNTYEMTIYSHSELIETTDGWAYDKPVYYGMWWRWLGMITSNDTKTIHSNVTYFYEVWATSSSYNIKRKNLPDGLEDTPKNWYYDAVSVNRKTLEVTYSEYGGAFVNEHGEIIGGILQGIYLPARTTVYDCESLESKNQI